MAATEHTVTPEDDGIRLDRWFKRHYPGLQHAMLEKILRKGQIRLDGKKSASSDRVAAGQMLLCPDMTEEVAPRPKRRASDQEMAEIRKWVIYKDDNIIVINKPFGIAVQGGSKITKCVDDMLDGLMFNMAERPKLVHRLDRDTSGVLVLARSSKVATQLMKLFSSRALDKTYWALVNNVPMPLKGHVDLPLRKKENPKASGIGGGPEGRDYEVVQVDEENGQKAVTDYRVIEFLARRFAFMELKPLTGRMHQLRVHMQAIGCPIVGDHKYGGSTTAARDIGVQDILHLHARRILIPSISGAKPVDVLAPLPEHMRRSFDALGLEPPKK
jgi:23S rRNA pseudouridine955/2504/2580 synthase